MQAFVCFKEQELYSSINMNPVGDSVFSSHIEFVKTFWS